jgi:dTDP-4-amino-4,6-dideoxygalactose transaminase
MIKLTKPFISGREARAVKKVLKSGNLTQGAVSKNFEGEISKFTQARHAFVTSSATTGLHLALDALGVGVGDEVIIPDFSFPATANAVIKVGATPVCADINLNTYCINVDDIQHRITSRTRAIMPVHAFGLCADMPAILEIAAKFNLKVVEDAACAIGGMIGTKQAGTFGDCGVFSFHPRKLITTGEGGAIVTDDESLAKTLSILRSHGGIRGEYYLEFIDSGYNFRLSDINSAVGLVQMSKLQEIIEKRINLAERYENLLGEIKGISVPEVPDGFRHTFQSYVIQLDDRYDRDEVIKKMACVGIETTLGTYSISSQPYFRKYNPNLLEPVPNSVIAFSKSLTLPLYPTMNVKKIDSVVRSLKDILFAFDL